MHTKTQTVFIPLLLAGALLLSACAPFITIQWQDEPTAIPAAERCTAGDT